MIFLAVEADIGREVIVLYSPVDGLQGPLAKWYLRSVRVGLTGSNLWWGVAVNISC